MYNGFEIDMLSLGDADCLVLTQWTPEFPLRILIDGGKSSDAAEVADFLLGRNFTYFYSVVCSHAHEDHAGGLIKIAKDHRFSFSNAWMHDIRNHISADALRRASAGNSSQAEGVKQVVETTKELASAFRSRNVIPTEPFAGAAISFTLPLAVLGPSLDFYRKTVEEFTKVEPTVPQIPPEILAAAAAALGGDYLGKFGYPPIQMPSRPSILTPLPSSLFGGTTVVPALGALSNSSVKENPTTQPFNNTSVILGATYGGHRLLFTADAGSDALDRVPPEWKALTWLQVPHHGSDGNLSQKNIERFCPQNAYISACGDSSHPSRAIVSGLIKCGAQVFSTHQNPHHLQFHIGKVPNRSDYGPAVAMRGTGNPEPVVDWTKLLLGYK